MLKQSIFFEWFKLYIDTCCHQARTLCKGNELNNWIQFFFKDLFSQSNWGRVGWKYFSFLANVDLRLTLNIVFFKKNFFLFYRRQHLLYLWASSHEENFRQGNLMYICTACYCPIHLNIKFLTSYEPQEVHMELLQISVYCLTCFKIYNSTFPYIL